MRLPHDGVAKAFPTERACSRRLRKVRWPEGVRCTRCEAKNVGHLAKRQSYYCRECRHQFSVTSQSLLHKSHLSPRKWFIAAEYVIGHYARNIGWDGPTGDALRLHLSCSYSAAHRLKVLLLDDLLMPDGGLLGRCVCTRPELTAAQRALLLMPDYSKYM